MKIIVMLERLKKVTAVAEELGMKQPTVSFHMRKLEEEWGLPLFETKTGKVLLTEAGRMLYPYARQIDSLYDEAQSRARELQRTGRRKFVVGCTDAAAALLLGGDGGARLPVPDDMTLSLQTCDEERLKTMLKDGEADLIVWGAPGSDAGDGGAAGSEMVAEFELALWTVADHPLLRPGREITAARLAEQPLVMLEDASLLEAVRQWEASGKAALRIDRQTDSLQLALGAVRTGRYAAILPFCADWEAGGQLCGIRLAGKAPTWRLYASWRSDFTNPQLMSRMTEALRHGWRGQDDAASAPERSFP